MSKNERVNSLSLFLFFSHVHVSEILVEREKKLASQTVNPTKCAH